MPDVFELMGLFPKQVAVMTAEEPEEQPASADDMMRAAGEDPL
jgi:hypothetical protein